MPSPSTWAWLVATLNPDLTYGDLRISAERARGDPLKGPRLQVTLMGFHGHSFEDAARKLRDWCREHFPWFKIA